MLYCAVRLRGVCPSLSGLPIAAVHPPKPALDDEREARERLRQEAARFEAEEHTKFEILEFDSAASFLSEGGRTCDILFLDIDMPQMTGMELAEKIRETDSEVIIIFCTNLLLGAALAFLLVWGCFDCSAVQAFYRYLRLYRPAHHQQGHLHGCGPAGSFRLARRFPPADVQPAGLRPLCHRHPCHRVQELQPETAGEREMAVIHIENYTPAPLVQRNGEYVTTKENPSGHGYGLKSIRNIAELYSGTADCFVEDSIFCLLVTFPCAELNARPNEDNSAN